MPLINGYQMMVMAALMLASATGPGTGETSGPGIIFGQWKIVSHLAVRISAMSDEEANHWHGKTAQYSELSAGFLEEICKTPSYSIKGVSEDDFFREFRADFKNFGIMGHAVPIVEVSCNGLWIAPGSTLIVKSRDTIVTLWNGVFFEFRRQ